MGFFKWLWSSSNDPTRFVEEFPFRYKLCIKDQFGRKIIEGEEREARVKAEDREKAFRLLKMRVKKEFYIDSQYYIGEAPKEKNET